MNVFAVVFSVNAEELRLEVIDELIIQIDLEIKIVRGEAEVSAVEG